MLLRKQWIGRKYYTVCLFPKACIPRLYKELLQLIIMRQATQFLVLVREGNGLWKPNRDKSNATSLLFARHFSKSHIHIRSFNPLSKSVRQEFLSPFHRWVNGGRRKISSVPSITELVRAEPEFQAQQPSSWFRPLSSASSHYSVRSCRGRNGWRSTLSLAISSPQRCSPWVNDRKSANPTEVQSEKALLSSTASSDNDRWGGCLVPDHDLASLPSL